MTSKEQKMRFAISVVLALCFSGPVIADGLLNIEGLSIQQQEEIKKNVERMKGKITPDTINEYTTLGTAIGKAISTTAQELGIAVNEFSTTPVGKISIGIIAWKLIGEDLMQIVVGGIVLIVGVVYWIRLFNKMCLIREIHYTDDKKTSVEHYEEGDCDITRCVMLFVLFSIICISQMIMWT